MCSFNDNILTDAVENTVGRIFSDVTNNWGQGNHYDGGTSEARFGAALPGDKLGGTTGAFQPFTQARTNQISGINQAFLQKQNSPGYVNEFGTSQSSTAGPSAFNAKFQDEYYNPMFEGATRAPIAGIMGKESYDSSLGGSNVYQKVKDSSQNRFISAEDVFNQAGLGQVGSDLISAAQEYMGAGHSAAGKESPMILKSQKGDFITAGQDLADYEDKFKQEEERIEEATEEASQYKDKSLLDSRIERQSILTDNTANISEARAAQGASGMAYSAPSTRQYEGVKEEGVRTLADLSREDSDTIKEYKSQKDSLAGDLNKAETNLASDRARFANTFSSITDKTATETGNLLGQAESVVSNWRDYGTSLSDSLEYTHKTDIVGKKIGSRGGYGGSFGAGSKNYYDEGIDAVPELGELGNLLTEVEDISMGFANNASNLFPSIEGEE